jgi:hypothetical protein
VEAQEAYIDTSLVSEATILVSLADKLDNARAILRDHRVHGDELWQRFSMKDPQEHLWYYRELLRVFRPRTPPGWSTNSIGCSRNWRRSRQGSELPGDPLNPRQKSW